MYIGLCNKNRSLKLFKTIFIHINIYLEDYRNALKQMQVAELKRRDLTGIFGASN